MDKITNQVILFLFVSYLFLSCENFIQFLFPLFPGHMVKVYLAKINNLHVKLRNERNRLLTNHTHLPISVD